MYTAIQMIISGPQDENLLMNLHDFLCDPEAPDDECIFQSAASTTVDTIEKAYEWLG